MNAEYQRWIMKPLFPCAQRALPLISLGLICAPCTPVRSERHPRNRRNSVVLHPVRSRPLSHNKTLRVDLTTETTQWDPQHRKRSGWVVFNNDTEENNHNSKGMYVGDYLPDFKAGHRIVPSSEYLVNAKITVSRLKKGRRLKVAGQWKLYFPKNIKIWRESGAGQWREIRSGTPYALPPSLFVAFKIEGVIPSQKSDDLLLSADFIPQGRTKPLRSTQVFMVTSGQGFLESNNTPNESVPDWIPRSLQTPPPLNTQ